MPLLREIESLDDKVPASAQLAMMFEVSRTLRHACYWLIEQYGDSLDIVKSVERLKDGMTQIYTRSGTYLSKASQVRNDNAEKAWMALGVAWAPRINVTLSSGNWPTFGSVSVS